MDFKREHCFLKQDLLYTTYQDPGSLGDSPELHGAIRQANAEIQRIATGTPKTSPPENRKYETLIP